MTKRVLMICDAFGGKISGAIAARSAAWVWTELGFEVGVYSPVRVESDTSRDEPQIQFYQQVPFRSVQHVFPGEMQNQFEQVLADFKPDVIFFLGTPHSKPTCLLESAKKSGARTIFMIWVQSFYCARTYAVWHGQPCNQCAAGNFVPSFQHRCGSFPSLLRSVIVRQGLRKWLCTFDVLMCSSQDLAENLIKMGFPRAQIRFCPLFVDAARVKNLTSEDGNYYIYYSQPIEPKGWHLIAPIIRGCPNAQFVLCPTSSDLSTISPDLYSLIDDQRVRLITGLTWQTGLADLVAKSRGVVIPSVWPTTTEYVLLEALGLRKPVVAFNVGIHQEILHHRENAMVADAVKVEQFIQHIRSLDDDPALRQHLSGAAYELYTRMTDRKVFLQSLQSAL
jgi:glycosyltransferase involved in cell wall biosynthesis